MNTIHRVLCAAAMIVTMGLGVSAVAAFRVAVAVVSSIVDAPFAAFSKVFAKSGPPSSEVMGEYYLSADNVPAAFNDIHYIELSNDEPRGLLTASGAPKGLVKTYAPLKFAQISIGGREIFFKTEVVDGISYQFAGKFAFANDPCSGSPEASDLTGDLIKIKDGKNVGEMQAEFYAACGY